MKKIILILLLLLSPVFSYCEEKLTVTFFYSPYCKACLDVKTQFLPAVKDKYKDKIEFKELDTYSSSSNLSLLLSLGARFKEGKVTTPTIWIGDELIVGKKEIESRLEERIEFYLNQMPHTPVRFFKVDILQVFRKLSVFTVVGSGLIDGINPCAFAVIVFFVSFLTVYGYKKREIILVGFSYCFAVFLTYLLIGLGFFEFLYKLAGYYLIIKFFYILVSLFCFSLFTLSLHDYFKFKKTGESDAAVLQLPKFFKKKINIIIGSRLRDKSESKGKNERGAIDLMLTSFGAGFLVSLLEAVCTGQVYLPTIVFILKNTSLRIKAVTYLVLYNLMFILPLIVIFFLSLLGFSSQKFNNFLKRNVGGIKLLMAVLFFILGVVFLGEEIKHLLQFLRKIFH